MNLKSMGFRDREQAQLQGSLRAVPVASCSPFAADCLAILLLAGSGLSFRASGFALWAVCYQKKNSAAARGSKSKDLPAVRLRTWRLNTLSAGPVARKPTCRLCGIQAAAAQKPACSPCNRKLLLASPCKLHKRSPKTAFWDSGFCLAPFQLRGTRFAAQLPGVLVRLQAQQRQPSSLHSGPFEIVEKERDRGDKKR